MRKFSTPIYGFCVAINAIGYETHSSHSHHAVIRVYVDVGKMIDAHEHKGDFKECERCRAGNKKIAEGKSDAAVL